MVDFHLPGDRQTKSLQLFIPNLTVKMWCALITSNNPHYAVCRPWITKNKTTASVFTIRIHKINPAY